MAAFSERLKQLRRENHMTQEALGAVIGVSKHSVCIYEKGKNYPEMKNFLVLAEYFHVSLDYLAGRTENREVNR